MMKKYNMLFLVLAVFAVLAGCHKDGIPDKAEPKVTELTVVPAQTGAVFSWKVEMPGKYQTCIEVSGKEDMTDAQSVEATENDGKYEASVGNLLPDTAYYYRVVVWNSFLSHKDGLGSFSTLAADPEPGTPDVFTVSLVADPAEGGTMTGGGDYLADSVCTVTATANEGYCFVNWTENDEQVSTDSAYTFTVTETATYIAHFQKKTYTVSVAADPEAGGTVTGGGTFEHGQSCTVKATANEGYAFERWTEDGTTITEAAEYTFTVTGDCTLTATFAEVPPGEYVISVEASPTDGGTVSGGGTYTEGSQVTLTATANSGYTFSQWQDGNTSNPRTIIVTGDATYTATFTPNIYTISVTANPSNGGTVSGDGVYTYGQSCTLTATANSGYTFSQWQDGNTNNLRTITVTGNATYTAYFNAQAPIGAINGLFTINDNGDQVYFSQGNLQYQASTNTWRFAENQWNYVGQANSNISQSYDGWIDLFGWGTSGWNCGNTYFNPWDSDNSDGSLYGPYGFHSLTGSYANADWGKFNSIINGGNSTGRWHTLAYHEWNYVFFTRITTSGIRFAKALVDDVKGVILLPDDWNTDVYNLNETNLSDSDYNSNVISASQWMSMENAGAVFLPGAGDRNGISVFQAMGWGYYWSNSANGNSTAFSLVFTESNIRSESRNRYYGHSVRLVCPAE